MMFGRDAEALKLELERVGKHLGKRLDEMSERLDRMEALIDEQEKQKASEGESAAAKMDCDAKKLSEALERLDERVAEFGKSVASFNNIKNRIDDMLYKRIKEIADEEIAAVRKRISEFSSIEAEFKSMSSEMARMRLEMAKWNAISSQVKETDFSLQKHAKELQLADSRKLELERENENLKSILSKMKRARHEHSRN